MGRKPPELHKIDGEDARECSTCHTIKKFTEFNKSKIGSFGLQSSCRECGKKFVQDTGGIKAYNLKYRYNISVEEYEKLYNEQEGKCKICNKKFDVLRVDHCHDTNIIRGLLCNGCNIAIGYLGEDPLIVMNALEYLRDFQFKQMLKYGD